MEAVVDKVAVAKRPEFKEPPPRKRAEHSPLGTPGQPAACARLVAKRAETMLAVLGGCPPWPT